jgi:BirA family biotin operon repressor/biotin-[acetyl-CoA-carboxylase] ligase
MSPPGGLYLSVVLRPAFPIERWPLIGLACALGTAAAAEAHMQLPSGRTEGETRGRGGVRVPVRLKWPNDLLLDGRKVGGILVEVSGDAAVCGIGVNVVPPTRSGPSWTSSPGSVDNAQPGSPGSTPAAGERTRPADATGATWLGAWNSAVSVAGLAPDVLLECERRYAVLAGDPDAVLTEWRTRTVTLGQRVRIDVPEPFEGVAVNVDAGGALLVQTASGIRRVLAGEVI